MRMDSYNPEYPNAISYDSEVAGMHVHSITYLSDNEWEIFNNLAKQNPRTSTDELISHAIKLAGER